MQTVINISEETYNEIIKDTITMSLDAQISVINAIQDGTPLPKGHGRLVDADKIILEATERMKYPANHEYMECVIAHMKLADTIIEADKESEE